MSSTITVRTVIAADATNVWEAYTQPEHITQWNFADPSWHCPRAENTMEVGGRYVARMEARDGSFGFDFEAVYEEIVPGERFTYAFGDRRATVVFLHDEQGTEVVVTFTPEDLHPLDMQRAGWQSILDSFKRYVER
jgi:uncharacterized protein YndB with AHSA1/START domain